MSRTRLRLALAASALAGFALMVFLVGWYGFGAVAAAALGLGWHGLLALAALHLVLMLVCGVAWRAVMAPARRVGVVMATAARILRDAGSELLPFSAAGGAVMGARALMLARMPGVGAFASTVVDMTLEMVAQLGFTALGVFLLLHGGWAPELGTPALVGLAIAVAGGLGFVLAQRAGLFRLLETLTRRIALRSAAAPRGEGVHDAIHDAYGRPGGVSLGTACHFAAWLATSLEAWVALHFLGAHLPLAAVLALESFTYAARSAAFFVPSGLGVQEGGYVVLGAIFGLGPETALALSLAKRARELAIGVPALLLWQAIEARKWRGTGLTP
jgi:putative membrane protein